MWHDYYFLLTMLAVVKELCYDKNYFLIWRC